MPSVPSIAILSAVAIAAAVWSSVPITGPGMTWLPICGALPVMDEPALAWTLGQWRPSDMAAMWIVMVAAMMPPLIARPLDHICRLSFAERRRRAIGLFTSAYGAAWVVAGVPLVLLTATAAIALPGPYSVGAAVALAALVWQVSPLKQRCLNRCHLQPPLRAFGSSADQDVVRFGVEHAMFCIGACWPLMLLSQVPGPFHLPVMIGSALFALGERYESPRPPAWGWKGPGTIIRLATARSRVAIATPLSKVVSSLRLGCRN